MDREEILLKGYEVCQQNISFNASRYWTIVGIFLALSTAVLVGILYGALSNNDVFIKTFQGYAPPQVFVVGTPMIILGAAMVAILALLKRWISRVNWLVSVSYFRMREIEAELGMLKNLTIHWLDNPDEAPEGQKERINELRRRYSPPLREMKSLNGIFYVLISLWGIAILAALVIVICALCS